MLDLFSLARESAPVRSAPAAAPVVAESAPAGAGPSVADLVRFVESESARRGPGFFRDMAARGHLGWSSNMRAAILRAFLRAAAESAAAPAAPAAESLLDGAGFAGIVALFDRARAAGLKFPKVLVLVPGFGKVRLSLAGPRARVPGSLNVAEAARFGEGRWFGRILPTGEFEPCLRDGPLPEGLRESLVALAADPAAAASTFGRLTGGCCFCARELTDGRSIRVGYGPVCAGKFGLSWGLESGPAGLVCLPAAEAA